VVAVVDYIQEQQELAAAVVLVVLEPVHHWR
jgi:hypothetical protein